ncbi:MAG: cytochrome c family protein [Pseudomonadota bacterium]
MAIRLGFSGFCLAALALAGCSETESTNTIAPSENTTAADVVTVNQTESTPSIEFEALPEPFKSADYEQGRKTYRLCQSCHTLQEGGTHLVGPNLHGIFGQGVGVSEGFAYSPALQEADFVWTPEQLDEWLTNPRSFLPGNRMSFAGVRKDEDRTAVIAYIMSQTGYAGTE